jgi:hypothetical protein
MLRPERAPSQPEQREGRKDRQAARHGSNAEWPRSRSPEEAVEGRLPQSDHSQESHPERHRGPRRHLAAQ